MSLSPGLLMPSNRLVRREVAPVGVLFGLKYGITNWGLQLVPVGVLEWEGWWGKMVFGFPRDWFRLEYKEALIVRVISSFARRSEAKVLLD